MTRLIETLRRIFGRDQELAPSFDHLLHGSLNPSAHNELFYAQLIEGNWAEGQRDYPWPPGFNG